MPSATITSATIASTRVNPAARARSTRRIAVLRDRELAVELARQRVAAREARTGHVELEGRELAAREDHHLRRGIFFSVDRRERLLEPDVLAVELEREIELFAWQRVLVEQAIARDLEPLELLVVVGVEAIAAGREHQAVVAALHQC